MIVRATVGQSEADRHDIQKGRIGELCPRSPEIGGHFEHKFERSGAHVVTLQEWRIAAPVVIGENGFQQTSGAGRLNGVEMNRDALRGLAGSGIQNVRCQTSGRRTL